MFEFKLPDIGEGVTEGEIVEWHVSPGDEVQEDEPMVEVMTDKATVTIGAPKTGVISELRYSVGDTAGVGTVLVVMDPSGATSVGAQPAATPPSKPDAAPAPPAPAPPAPARHATDDGPAASAVGDIREGLPGSSYFASGVASTPAKEPPPLPTPVEDFFAEHPLATPATRKLARDLDLDLRTVRPTGPGGRVTKEDLRNHVAGRRGAAPQPTDKRINGAAGSTPSSRGALGAATGTAPTATPTPSPSATNAGAAAAPAGGPVRETRKPFVGIRRKIAEKMQTAKNTAAHFTFVEECDCTQLIELRARLKSRAAASGVKLSYLPFIVKATVAALKRHPTLNCMLDESTNELVTRGYYHVGIAAATDSGLMVPVIRDADQKSILELAKEIDRLGEGARSGGLASQDLSGSTFTITSLGKQGGLFATPVLNHPEVGILGVHRMKEKPVIRDGAIAIGQVMLLSLSFDHRIVDGHVGAAFAYEIIDLLEDPDRLLLET